jgi:hypothetical protein
VLNDIRHRYPWLRHIEADLWDRGYLDLVAPAAAVIGADKRGEITEIEKNGELSAINKRWFGVELTKLPPMP